jgi:hypothetical protein
VLPIQHACGVLALVLPAVLLALSGCGDPADALTGTWTKEPLVLTFSSRSAFEVSDNQAFVPFKAHGRVKAEGATLKFQPRGMAPFECEYSLSPAANTQSADTQPAAARLRLDCAALGGEWVRVR